jgi:hypothetical protein
LPSGSSAVLFTSSEDTVSGNAGAHPVTKAIATAPAATVSILTFIWLSFLLVCRKCDGIKTSHRQAGVDWDQDRSLMLSRAPMTSFGIDAPRSGAFIQGRAGIAEVRPALRLCRLIDDFKVAFGRCRGGKLRGVASRVVPKP